jgi:hypothetical protein
MSDQFDFGTNRRVSMLPCETLMYGRLKPASAGTSASMTLRSGLH